MTTIEATPEKIYTWVQNRYGYYDNIEERNTEEEYTDVIFQEASVHFNKGVEELVMLYTAFIYEAKEILEKYKQVVYLETEKATHFNGKSVILDVSSILERKADTSSDKFLEFVKENEAKIFTAETDPNAGVMYHLKEDGFWLFSKEDLMEVDLSSGDGKYV